jgi:hypothetical protein
MKSTSIKWRLVLIAVTPAVVIGVSTGFVADIGDPTAAMWIRRALELTVMALQVGGLAALIASRLVPASLCAGSALIGVQLGLGVAGSLCAVYRSDFTLVAGATLGALLVAFTWGEMKHLSGGAAIAARS